MSIPATEAATPPGMYQPATTTQRSDADKEMFLNLMVAQLRYQDPLNPSDSAEFLAQSAQFTSLEKLQDVADQTAALLSSSVAFGASNMVGQHVTYIDADGNAISGVVQSVTFDANGPLLQVGGKPVSLGQVQSVGQAPTDPSGDTGDSGDSGGDNTDTNAS